MDIKKIATIYNGFSDKFGIPRQSGLVNNISKIVFEPEYSVLEAFRGLNEFEYVWLIWEFSAIKKGDFSPTVRPPRLGGNKKIGVFATRSPFRPNQIGLSSVKLLNIEKEDNKIVLYVLGADILSGTPIYDIKPYIPYTDCHVNAKAGFSDNVKDNNFNVIFDCYTGCFDKTFIKEINEILTQNPAPHYIEDNERIYGFFYENYEIKFKIENDIVHVLCIVSK